MKIYIAGPMTGYRDHNFPAFEKEARELRAVGHEVLSPHEVDHGETEETRGSKSWCDYLKEDLKVFLECDAIYMLRGWDKSKGAMVELDLALKLGFAVYFQDPDVYDVFEVITDAESAAEMFPNVP